MAFKDTWVDKVDGQDYVQAEDINKIAGAIIGLEKDEQELQEQIESTVKYIPQELTDEQKAQARANISAIAEAVDVVADCEPGGYYRNGVWNTAPSYTSTRHVPCSFGDVVKLKGSNHPNGFPFPFLYHVSFYDANKNFISMETNKAFTQVGNTRNSESQFTVSKENAAFFTFELSSTTFGYISGYVYKPINALMATSNLVLDTPISPEFLEHPWRGKNWIAFGTSFTDTGYTNAETGEVTGKYVPYLAALSGLTVDEQGIAGGTIGSGGIHGGSNSILNHILAYNVSGADLITIEGCVNDFAAAVSIGSPGDTENTTICGAYYQAIKYCLENSNATVVLLTESTGRQYTLTSTNQTVDYTITRKNSIEKTQNDYNDAIRAMGRFMGVHVIDAGGKSQINEMHPEYLIDHLHHTALGGKQYAETIWDELKNIHCNSDD